MHSEIVRFEPFASLDRSELELVARNSRCLALPGGRWLLRPGRALRGHHFLLSGSVATLRPAGVISAGQEASRQALYPGASGLRTLSVCRILQVPEPVIDFLRAVSQPAQLVLGEPEDCWQARFLGTGLMAALPPAVWQSVLGRLQSRTVLVRERIIRERDPESRFCYVLAEGIARVERQGGCLTVLQPGELFGEDALITREPRNASVVMETDGRVMSLDALEFRRLLVELLKAGVYRPPETGIEEGTRVLLRLGSSHDLRQRIAGLSPSAEYLVSSVRPEIESLAVFLMRKAGLAAWVAPRL